MKVRFPLVVVLFAAAAGGCGSFGAVGDAEWSLVAESPDGQTLLVETGFGGVAAGCARFEGWEVEADDDTVDVRARLWEAIAPQGCTDELVIERHAVLLDEPLGDRSLVGCGSEDCLVGGRPTNGALQSLPSAAIADASIVVPTVLGAEAFGSDGMSLWSAPMDRHRLAADGDLVVGERAGGLVALDATTGASRWETNGLRLGGFSKGQLVLCRWGNREISAVDRATGRVDWAVFAGCEPSARVGDRIVIPTRDGAIDGGMRLRVVEASSGEVLVDRALDDGIDDQVEGIDGAVAVGDVVMLSGVQSDLIIVDANGEETVRRPDAPGWPLGAVGDVGVFASPQGVTAVDGLGEQRWFASGVDWTSVAIADDHLFAIDPDAGLIRRFSADVSPADPAAADWSASVGRTSAWSVSSDGDVVVVMTMLAVVVLDAETGELQWWEPAATSG